MRGSTDKTTGTHTVMCTGTLADTAHRHTERPTLADRPTDRATYKKTTNAAAGQTQIPKDRFLDRLIDRHAGRCIDKHADVPDDRLTGKQTKKHPDNSATFLR